MSFEGRCIDTVHLFTGIALLWVQEENYTWSKPRLFMDIYRLFYIMLIIFKCVWKQFDIWWWCSISWHNYDMSGLWISIPTQTVSEYHKKNCFVSKANRCKDIKTSMSPTSYKEGMEMSWNGLIQHMLHFPKKRCSQTKHRRRAAWVGSTFTLEVLTVLLQQWSAFVETKHNFFFFGDWNGLLYQSWQVLIILNQVLKCIHEYKFMIVHASKCFQFGFFQSLIMIIISIAWKGNVASLVMSSSHRHASSASCSWITAKGTEKMSMERDSAWRVKCYSATVSIQLICKQANKLKVCIYIYIYIITILHILLGVVHCTILICMTLYHCDPLPGCQWQSGISPLVFPIKLHLPLLLGGGSSHLYVCICMYLSTKLGLACQ